MPNSEPFRYQPLSNITSIRLVRLQPDLIEDQIAITLSHFKIDTVPNYHALSYHWGDPTPTRSININRHMHRIHENLWQFLNQMSVAGTSDYLWTDFLCLDQHNIAEISKQVARMGDIYSQAEQVFMWLGHDQAGENAMESIRNWPGEVQVSYEAMQLGHDWLKSTRLVEEKIDHDKILTAVLHILLRPYWKRIWIIQEAVLAKKAFLLYGKASMRLEEFRSRVDPFRHRRSEFRFGSNIWTICGLRERMGRKPLWELLIDFENSVSTQRLDKIYGILGLVANTYFEEPMLVQVDYQKSVHLVFWETVFFSCVPWNRAYDFLTCMGRMFYEGGIDMWDFRHLENFAASLNLDEYCYQSAKTALSTFHSMNLLFDTSGFYSNWEKSFQYLVAAVRHENGINTNNIRTIPPMIGIVLATLDEHIHRIWQVRSRLEKSQNISKDSQWRCEKHHRRRIFTYRGFAASSTQIFPFQAKSLEGLCGVSGEDCNYEDMYLDVGENVSLQVRVHAPQKAFIEIKCRK